MTERFIDIKVRTGNSEATVKSLDAEVKKLAVDTQKTTKQTDKLKTSVSGLGKELPRLTKSAAGVKKGIAGIGRGAGQAGIQVQQFIGQIQGGQGVMLALSQQSADLGFVLGAPLLGAIAGISASMIGILAPSFFKTSEAAKDFTFNVVEATEKLEDLSKAQVAVALTKTSKSLDDLAKEAKKAGDDVFALSERLDRGEKIVTDFTKSGTVLISTIKLTADETKKLSIDLNQARANLDKINTEYKKESDLLVQLSKNKDGYSKSTEEQAKATKDVSESLNAQIVALRDGEEAALRYSIAQQLGLKSTKEIPTAIDDEINALFKLREAKRQAAEDERQANRQKAIDERDAKKRATEGASAAASAGRFGERLSQETERLQTELELRKQVEAGFISQRAADLSAGFLSGVSRQDAAFNAEIVKLGENELAKVELTALFMEQRLIAVQVFEDKLLSIEDVSSKERIQLNSNELQSKIQMTQGIIGILGAFAGKSKTASRAIMLVQGALSAFQIYASTQAAAAMVLATPPGPILNPALIPAAAAIASAGKISAAGVLAGSIAGSLNIGGGGGSSGGGSAATGAATTPSITQDFEPDVTVDSSAITALTNELRNRDPDEPLTVGFTQRVIAAITDFRASGQA